MNRRMRRERERAKFEAARQRALARLGRQWQQLQERLRHEDVLEPLPPSIRRTVDGYAGTGRVLVVGPGGVTTDLGIRGVSFALGHLPVPHSVQAGKSAAERDFIEAGMATGSSPADPWPCGDCMVETSQQPILGGRSWRTVERTRTCDMCRAQGAPEYLP